VYKQSQLKRTFDLSTFNVSTNSSSVQDEFSSDNACNSASSNFAFQITTFESLKPIICYSHVLTNGLDSE